MFDEENAPEGYKCDCGGSILLYDGMWCCDKCDFEVPDNRNTKTNKPFDKDKKRQEGYGKCTDCIWYGQPQGCNVKRNSNICRLNKKTNPQVNKEITNPPDKEKAIAKLIYG